ncbi:MAG: amidohydrolase [Candidatus Latescibacteria bacterium]|nr:amidohydrolase [Candidatus Latescibacterota bacterium]
MNDIWSTVRGGQILEGEVVIDCHTHMGPWFNFSIPQDPWAEGIITALDTCGIQKVICAPHVGIVQDAPWGNEIIAAVVRRYPERFVGYCTVNPNYPEDEMVGEMEKHIIHGNLKGIKIHPATHLYPADGPHYRPMWEFANEHALPVLVHTWESAKECDPRMFIGIGREFQEVKILLGHSGATAKGVDQAVEAATQCENLYLDLTSSILLKGMLEVMVKAVGAGRVLFGTDVPFLDCRGKIGYISIARISDDEKRKILGLNATQLFKL